MKTSTNGEVLIIPTNSHEPSHQKHPRGLNFNCWDVGGSVLVSPLNRKKTVVRTLLVLTAAWFQVLQQARSSTMPVAFPLYTYVARSERDRQAGPVPAVVWWRRASATAKRLNLMLILPRLHLPLMNNSPAPATTLMEYDCTNLSPTCCHRRYCWNEKAFIYNKSSISWMWRWSYRAAGSWCLLSSTMLRSCSSACGTQEAGRYTLWLEVTMLLKALWHYKNLV